MYTVDYFINFYQSIPEERMIPFSQSDGKGNHCALGWFSPSASIEKLCSAMAGHDEFITWEDAAYFEKEKSLLELLGKIPGIYDRENYVSDYFNRGSSNMHQYIVHINNGNCLLYQQPTPKQRILAALDDVKKMQTPQHEDIRKKLAVMPVDETSDVLNELSHLLV